MEQLHIVRQSERESAERKRIGGGIELAVDGVAAFAVERVALGERALRGGDDVAFDAQSEAVRFRREMEARFANT